MDVIVDIDGTLADGTHRVGFVKSTPKNWPAYQAGCHLDSPISPVIAFVDAYLESNAGHVILCSGRSEEVREQTLEWLSNHAPGFNKLSLYMRSAGDYRRDDIIKLELLEQIRKDGYNPVIAIDDRPRVLRAWRSAGIFTFNVCQHEEEF